MTWAVTRVTGPSQEALTTTEAKKHLRVEHSDEDSYIGSLSQSWREWLEERTNRTFVKSTWDYFRDEFPEGSEEPIELPFGPVISVTSVKYTTTSATTTTTLSATAYSVDTDSEPARIGLREGETWPTKILRDENGVEVRYDAGFATTATGVPQRVKHALRLLVADSYVYREASMPEQTMTAAERLISNIDARRYM